MNTIYEDIENTSGYATYCPEDNKLRLYVGRVPREEYLQLRKDGFKSTPKQDCDFVATWGVGREDIALKYGGGTIEDEDTDPTERAADRADRFAMYRDKRRGEAHEIADNYDDMAMVSGHQNEKKAEAQARRKERTGARACNQWDKAEYWQQRTSGVIANALHKANPRVRRGRILKLEAEQRKHLASIDEAQIRYDLWLKVQAEQDEKKCFDMAYNLANVGGGCWSFAHPRTGEKWSMYSHLTDDVDPITGQEAATIYFAKFSRAAPGRWAAHYENRLNYEREMLENEGGAAGNLEMVCGGFIKDMQIIKISKSPVTKAVTSVTVEGGARYSVKRMGEDAYRAPTDEEAAAFIAKQAATKAEAKKNKKKAPPLINPTMEAAQEMQNIINAENAGRNFTGESSEVIEMTQAEYSALSQGTYSACRTYFVEAGGNMQYEITQYYGGKLNMVEPIFKARIMYRTGTLYAANRVIVITDKKQKAFPAGWQDAPKAEAEKVTA